VRFERDMAKVVQLATMAAVLQIAGYVCALAVTIPGCPVKEGTMQLLVNYIH